MLLFVDVISVITMQFGSLRGGGGGRWGKETREQKGIDAQGTRKVRKFQCFGYLCPR